MENGRYFYHNVGTDDKLFLLNPYKYKGLGFGLF